MKRSEVPPGCRAVQCQSCGDVLAIPADGDPAQVQARCDEAMADHLQLCPSLADHRQIVPGGETLGDRIARDYPEPVELVTHDTLREQVRALCDDLTWCPSTFGHHCSHWKTGPGGHCCNCHEDHRDDGPC